MSSSPKTACDDNIGSIFATAICISGRDFDSTKFNAESGDERSGLGQWDLATGLASIPARPLIDHLRSRLLPCEQRLTVPDFQVKWVAGESVHKDPMLSSRVGFRDKSCCLSETQPRHQH